MSVRQVACGAGCPNPGSVALDAVGKTRIRFSGLTTEDAPALADATLRHDASTHGNPRTSTGAGPRGPGRRH